MTKTHATIAGLLTFGIWASAQAVPVLQIGTPASGTTCGPYAAYTANSTNPTETDTAITGSNTLCVGGVYGNGVQNLGAQFGSGLDWSALNSALTSWNGKGAVLIASVADGQLAAASGLKINGVSAFGTSTLENFYPNSHDPVKTAVSDFLFFDIDDFTNTANAVADFASNTGAADGQVKTLTISGQGTLAWIHFDVMALETGGNNTNIRTTLANNPGSHDVTWKNPGGGGNQTAIPEPGSLALAGLALLGAYAVRRRKI